MQFELRQLNNDYCHGIPTNNRKITKTPPLSQFIKNRQKIITKTENSNDQKQQSTNQPNKQIDPKRYKYHTGCTLEKA